MPSLRSVISKNNYSKYKAENFVDGICDLCEKIPIQDFVYWKIVENSFPYDLIAKTHHMLLPIRHASETALNDKESKELQNLKMGVIAEEYDYILENTLKNKSAPEHFHLHLIVGISSEDTN